MWGFGRGAKKYPDSCIDLVVTSPPYDTLRVYNGFTFDLHAIGEQIFRVLKEGGVCVMVIQDSTNDSLTSKSFQEFLEKEPLSWAMTSGDNIEYMLETPSKLLPQITPDP